ncbi:hypothetical protein NMY22_g17530 [Coprinellus aureogranulatus]|nr:hypothetical protein NMY22_g17530 [Coprinellus aureogranulatus]
MRRVWQRWGENAHLFALWRDTSPPRLPFHKEDWGAHKVKCGKTDRIDLISLYPLIALLMEAHRHHELTPLHPALTHKITSAPLPCGPHHLIDLPDGKKASLVVLGDEIDANRARIHKAEWWPSGVDQFTRIRFMKRISSPEFLLPSIIASLVALAIEVYSTDYISAADSPDGRMKRRVRLTYHGSPVWDFGVVKGRVDVLPENRLVFLDSKTRIMTAGPDPEEHYWIYFTTAAGEDFILDCGLYAFNIHMLAQCLPYTKHGNVPSVHLGAAFFRDREHLTYIQLAQNEEQRFSVLREPTFTNGDVFKFSKKCFSDADVVAVCSFFERIQGTPPTWWERNLMMQWVVEGANTVQRNVETREYLNYPKVPLRIVEGDDAIEDTSFLRMYRKE